MIRVPTGGLCLSHVQISAILVPEKNIRLQNLIRLHSNIPIKPIRARSQFTVRQQKESPSEMTASAVHLYQQAITGHVPLLTRPCTSPHLTSTAKYSRWTSDEHRAQDAAYRAFEHTGDSVQITTAAPQRKKPSDSYYAARAAPLPKKIKLKLKPAPRNRKQIDIFVLQEARTAPWIT